ncbi:hypothetical protein GCM10010387_54260 [Streptomyces inusitatus]|uniref:Uncharacterized protein n=1 Tax=Streptomyces inusitatus TaxID=68221 RepID=A0A918V146_9ACTN|nr:hypothetical protein [Streptomyces inusitatus]GGZ53227.1 hypothetical protein GCM10010387_54260 [Streptomyces inusitatus]
MSGGLAVGDIAYDADTRALGVVMAECATHYALRPVDGGLEWEAVREDVRPPTDADRLSAAVAERNANSRKRTWQ